MARQSVTTQACCCSRDQSSTASPRARPAPTPRVGGEAPPRSPGTRRSPGGPGRRWCSDFSSGQPTAEPTTRAVVLGDERGEVRVVEVLLPLGQRLLVGRSPAENVGARPWCSGSSRSSRASAGMSARTARRRRAAGSARDPSARRGPRACAGARTRAGTTPAPAPRRARAPARSARCGPRRPSGSRPRRTGRGRPRPPRRPARRTPPTRWDPRRQPRFGAPSR